MGIEKYAGVQEITPEISSEAIANNDSHEFEYSPYYPVVMGMLNETGDLQPGMMGEGAPKTQEESIKNVKVYGEIREW